VTRSPGCAAGPVRACPDALPAHHTNLRVAGPTDPILPGQRSGDTDLAPRGRSTTPSSCCAPAQLAGPSPAGHPRPPATPSPARAPNRLPTHPPGLAPAPGHQEVDTTAVTRTPAPTRGSPRPHPPTRHGEPPLGIPPRPQRTATPSATRSAPPPYAESSAPQDSAPHPAPALRDTNGAPFLKAQASGLLATASSTSIP
jgi:hypothetical protein